VRLHGAELLRQSVQELADAWKGTLDW
jgi:hypothetical protein